MWADGLLLQGRRTKRKWKLIWMLLAAALLSLGGAWLAEHPEAMKNMAAAVRASLLPEETEEWIALPAGGTVRAVAGDAMICTSPGRVYAAGPDGTLIWARDTGPEEMIVCGGAGYAAVYGAGDTALRIAGPKGCMEIPVSRGVDLAAAGPKGQAAAVTAAVMLSAAAPGGEIQEIELIFDRPFLYCLMSSYHDMPFFIGVVNQVE